MGRKRLYNELLQKGVDKFLIQQVLNQKITEEVELSLAKDLIRKKLMRIQINEKDFNIQQERLKIFLYRRGFSFSVIEQALIEIF